EELTARRLAIRASVTSAYYDALTAQERVRLAEQAMELAQRASRAAGQRVKAGKVAPIEETKAHVAQAGVQVELSQARSEWVGAQARLAALLGEPGGLSWRLDAQLDALPAVPSMADLERSLDNAPALRRARLEIDRRQALTELEKARRIPDITVSLGAKRSEELGRNQAIVGLSVPLPIFDTNRGNLLEALKREEKAREGLSASQLQVSAEARETRARLASLRQEAQLFAEQVLPGAQSAYDAAAKGFELGKFSFLEALDAQRTLLQARSQYLRTLADTHRARADLDRLLGLDESTETPLAPATVRRTGE
ncbi:MAG: TolC family protein, partial [Burkholderiaceae bacterium]|nr:TolC family protein [Burkholderiaceae bacterium]